MLHELLAKWPEKWYQIDKNLVIVNLHENAERIEYIFKEGLIEIGRALLGEWLCNLLEAWLEPEMNIFGTGILNDCLKQWPSLFKVKMLQQNRVDRLEIVNDALMAH